MGDVGDELCLHALGACLLVDGLLDTGADALQIFLVLFQRGQPAGDGLTLVIGLAVGDGLPFLLQELQAGSQIQDPDGQHAAGEQPPERRRRTPVKHQKQIDEAEACPDQHCPPDHRDAPESPEDPREDHVDDRVFEKARRLRTPRNAQDERQRQSGCSEDEKNVIPAVDVPDFADERSPCVEQEDEQESKQIERDPVEPALIDAVHALLMSHGAQEENEQEQADRKKQHSQHDQQIARTDEPFDPRHNIQRGVARGERAFEVGLIDRRDFAAVVQRSGHVLLIIGGSLAGIIVFVQSAGAEQDLAGVFVGELEVDIGGERVIALAEQVARDLVVVDPGVQRRPAVAVRLLEDLVFRDLAHLLTAVSVGAVSEKICGTKCRCGKKNCEHDQQRDGRAFDPEFSVELFHCLSPSSL